MKRRASMFDMFAKALPLLLFVFALGSCLQAISEGPVPDAIPSPQPVESIPFQVDYGSDMIIVTLQGATVRTGLLPEHFSLTVDMRDVPLSAPMRGGDRHVLFGFDEPLERSRNYRLTVRPGAMETGPAIVRVWAQAVSSGLRTNLESTEFDDYAIRSVAYGGGIFVAAGDSGRMAFSMDGGESWVSVARPIGGMEGGIYGLAFGNNGADPGGSGGPLLYAVGADAQMSFSRDGINWTGHKLAAGSPYFGEVMFAGEDIRAVAFGWGQSASDRRFVAAGGGGRAAFRSWDTSMNLPIWRLGEGISPEQEIRAIAWGGAGGHGSFIAAGAGGSVYRAVDGVGTQTWYQAEDSTFDGYDINAAAFGNGVFVIGGEGGRIARSADGMNWMAADSAPVFGDYGILAIAFGSGVFMAAGEGGIIAQSVDGIVWEFVPDNGFLPGERIGGIATDGRGRFVAAGSGTGRIVSWYQRPVIGGAGGPGF